MPLNSTSSRGASQEVEAFAAHLATLHTADDVATAIRQAKMLHASTADAEPTDEQKAYGALSAFLSDHRDELGSTHGDAILAALRVAGDALEAHRPRTRVQVGRSAADLLATTPEKPDWLIPGVMARTWMIKVAAREKTGKGTLITHLLGKLERGESTVFGAATDPVSSLVFTEEPQDSFREKIEHARLEHAWIVFGHELAGMSWPEKAQHLVGEAARLGHGVVFVDNISRAAAVEDEAGVELARAAEVLGEAAKAAGVGVIIDHHHKKGAGQLDDKSRGGTALAGACDNNIELVRVGGWDSRVRSISSRGRVSATIWERQIALAEDGREYESVASAVQPQTVRERARLEKLSDAGDAGVTASEFAEALGVGDETARRQLASFVEHGWATENAKSYPKRWTATGEGLSGVPDLLREDDDA